MYNTPFYFVSRSFSFEIESLNNIPFVGKLVVGPFICFETIGRIFGKYIG